MKMEMSNKDIITYGTKYHFYYNEDSKTIVCTTLYKGQLARGIAKCNPDDSFDIEVGKKLAYLRCKQKFAQKKLKRARKAHREAIATHAAATNNLSKACEFCMDAEAQLIMATHDLFSFEAELN